jgi:hypothetical protein
MLFEWGEHHTSPQRGFCLLLLLPAAPVFHISKPNIKISPMSTEVVGNHSENDAIQIAIQ